MSRCVRAFSVLALLVTGVVLVGSTSPAGAVACTVAQVTDTVGPGVNAVAVDAAGDRMVVASSEGLDGDPNPGNNQELYIYDRSDDSMTRITNAPTGESYQAAMASDGLHVAFSSMADL